MAAARRTERSGTRAMTQAVQAARAAGVALTLHEYETGTGEGYGVEAALALGLPPERVFKTLLARLDGRELVVAVVPVAAQLELKALASAAGAKRAEMAPPAEAERATGYVVGGISPLGQKRKLRTFVDATALAFPTINVSAGRRGLELELAPRDLVALCDPTVAPIARWAER